jgi:hypothetical protein
MLVGDNLNDSQVMFCGFVVVCAGICVVWLFIVDFMVMVMMMVMMMVMVMVMVMIAITIVWTKFVTMPPADQPPSQSCVQQGSLSPIKSLPPQPRHHAFKPPHMPPLFPTHLLQVDDDGDGFLSFAEFSQVSHVLLTAPNARVKCGTPASRTHAIRRVRRGCNQEMTPAANSTACASGSMMTFTSETPVSAYVMIWVLS